MREPLTICKAFREKKRDVATTSLRECERERKGERERERERAARLTNEGIESALERRERE